MAQALMVDSAQAMNGQAWAGLTVFEVCQDYSQGPGKIPLQYVARYLTDLDGPILTAAEVVYVHGKGAAILPIWNGENKTTVAGGYAAGVLAANKAIAAARALQIPANVYIALDVEANWPITPEFLQGWADTMRASEFGGAGIIYSTADTIGPVYVKAMTAASATQKDNLQRLLFWIASWETGAVPLTADKLPTVDTATLFPAAPSQVVARQYDDHAYGDLADVSVLLTDKVIAPGQLWGPKATGGSNPPAPSRPLIAKVAGTISQGSDTFTFQTDLVGPTGTKLTTEFLLDTGSFEMLLTDKTAQALGLPNQGALDVSGVGGSNQTYQSQAGVILGGAPTFNGVHCVVDPSFQTQLFGLRFFINRGYLLELDTKAGTLTIYGPEPKAG